MEIQELEQFVREKAALRKWDAEGCLRIGAELAVKVNGISNLSGEEKKKLIVDLVLRGLREGEEKEKSSSASPAAVEARYDQLEKVVKETLPVSLELIVSASRGKLDLKKVKPSVWLRYCSCFVKGVVTVLVSQKIVSEEVGKKITETTTVVEQKVESVLDSETPLEATTENPMLQIRQVVEVTNEGSTEESKSENP